MGWYNSSIYFDMSLDELLLALNIKVIEEKRMSDKENDAVLITGISKSIIYLKANLDETYKKFLILHECGHCIYHFQQNGHYSYFQSKICGRLEKEANRFACQFMIKEENLEGRNIIDLLEHSGVPKNIAIQFYENRY